jgi:hypothetical protein
MLSEADGRLVRAVGQFAIVAHERRGAQSQVLPGGWMRQRHIERGTVSTGQVHSPPWQTGSLPESVQAPSERNPKHGSGKAGHPASAVAF